MGPENRTLADAAETPRTRSRGFDIVACSCAFPELTLEHHLQFILALFLRR